MRLVLRCVLVLILCGTTGFSVASAQTNIGTRTAATTPVSAQPLDLNTASAAQLKTLPGIGEAYARRILDARPYTAKNQLVTKGILPQSAYDRIKDSVVAHRTAKP